MGFDHRASRENKPRWISLLAELSDCTVLPGGSGRSGTSLRSRRIRSSSTLAGSSAGSWGTSLPSKARFKIDWRRRSARFRLAETAASRSSRQESRRSTSATMRICSASGGTGIGIDRMSAPDIPVCPAVVRALDSICRLDTPTLLAISQYAESVEPKTVLTRISLSGCKVGSEQLRNHPRDAEKVNAAVISREEEISVLDEISGGIFGGYVEESDFRVIDLHRAYRIDSQDPETG